MKSLSEFILESNTLSYDECIDIFTNLTQDSWSVFYIETEDEFDQMKDEISTLCGNDMTFDDIVTYLGWDELIDAEYDFDVEDKKFLEEIKNILQDQLDYISEKREFE